MYLCICVCVFGVFMCVGCVNACVYVGVYVGMCVCLIIMGGMGGMTVTE